MLSVIYAECRKQAHYAECHYTECRYAECRSADKDRSISMFCHAAQGDQGKYNNDCCVHRCLWTYVAVSGIIALKLRLCKHGFNSCSKNIGS
jgi:hypothetical protein